MGNAVRQQRIAYWSSLRMSRKTAICITYIFFYATKIVFKENVFLLLKNLKMDTGINFFIVLYRTSFKNKLFPFLISVLGIPLVCDKRENGSHWIECFECWNFPHEKSCQPNSIYDFDDFNFVF